MWSSDGSQIATPDSSGRVVIWDPQSATPVQVFEIGRPATAVAWSPDDSTLAVGVRDPEPGDDGAEGWSDDFTDWDEGRTAEDAALSAAGFTNQRGGLTVRLVDVASGLQVATLSADRYGTPPGDLVWGPSTEQLYVATGERVEEWHPYSGHLRRTLQAGADLGGGAVTLDQATGRIAALTAAGILLWSPSTSEQHLSGDGGAGVCLRFAPSGRMVVRGTETGIIEVWLLHDDIPDLRVLEGHASAVTGVSVSPDGRLVASRAQDGRVHLWDTESWELLSEYEVEAGRSAIPHIAFSPQGHVLATSAGDDLELHVIALDLPTLHARRHAPGTVHYANAKVVLLGDSGVGKSGLGLVLAGRQFQPTDSTHQRNVFRLSVTTSEDVDPPERREVFLWDLAGQPGYRLLHQLHLRDVAVAGLVFDAKDEIDPLGGVRYWARALRQAELHADEMGAARTQRILVAARMDRGRARVSDGELEELRREFGISEYVTTSAKEGIGVVDLRRSIDESIDWSAITKISSTGLFDSIRGFLLEKRESDVILASTSDLQKLFVATGVDVPSDIDAEFRSSIDRAEARGLLRRLSFGDFVLLRPEVLDAYAASVVHAASQDEARLGAIREDHVRSGNFFIPGDLRIQDRATEQLLLLATIEDLLRFEIALREESDDGSFLVFPTENTRRVEIPSSYRPWCDFRFDGPMSHIWATLIVRLTHSGLFALNVVAGNAVVLSAAGQRFAISRASPDEGRNELQLLRHAASSVDLEPVLEQFIASHLSRRAARGSVIRSAVMACPKCRFVIPEAVLKLLPEERVIRCSRCGAEVERDSGGGIPAKEPVIEIRGLNAAADRERERLVDRVTADGKAAIHEFDVFLAHNSQDRAVVSQLDSRLRDHGLSTWLDADQIPPGRWFQDVLQEAIGKVRTAAIFVGTAGLGRWERLELRAFVSRCIEEQIDVIPVLLPKAVWPSEVPFLKELNGVVFERTVEESEPFARLVWGITGDRQLRDRLLRDVGHR